MTVVEITADVVTRPLRRVEYEALIAQGFLVGEPIELVEGQLVRMSPQGDRHWLVCNRLTRLLIEAIPADEGFVSAHGPFAADDLSEPEPDLYATSPVVASRRGLPTGASLVIEVSNSSRAYDLGVKAALYARVGIPDHWVVDLRDDRVVVHREPVGGEYRSLTPVSRGVVSALHHPGVRIDVAVLLASP
jgi:Uma2 family endonuclease